jgi:hypothetical protein
MIARCENPNHNRYHRYGGRGISVCAAWKDFDEFAKWAVKSGYKKSYQIDRIDHDGDYEPDNCRWTTSRVNNRNRTNNRIVTWKGVSKTLADWADDPRSQVPYKVLWERLEDGWEFEKALMTPMRRKGGYRVITAFGESKSLTEWVEDPRCEVDSVKTLWKRINDGWPPERALTRPMRRRGVI